jgi:glutamate--cysteine ligase catalytic subunit
VKKERQDLKWGEEIEYQLFKYDAPDQKRLHLGLVKDLIIDFNEKSGGSEILLHPEFGQWMVEAVPGTPYDSIENPQVVLSVKSKLANRRRILNPYFKQNELYMVSLASPPLLGTLNHIEEHDQEEPLKDIVKKGRKNSKSTTNTNQFSES